MSGTAVESAHREPAPLARPDEPGVLVVLAGNPNVGKSTLFNRLTGLGVETAHYPGTTTEVQSGKTVFRGRGFTVADLPGAYGLSGAPDEQWTARHALRDLAPDVVVVVVDATNLARNLVLTLEVMESSVPVVVALNLTDEARHRGLEIDEALLSDHLGVPVVPMVASEGRGVEELVDAVLDAVGTPPATPPAYGDPVDGALRSLRESAAALKRLPEGFSARELAVAALRNDPELRVWLDALEDGAAFAEAARLARGRVRAETGERAGVVLARARHERAKTIAEEVATQVPASRARDLWSFTTSRVSGVIILLAVLAGVFGFLFAVGDALASGFSAMWAAYVSPVITDAVTAVAGDTALGRTLLWGLDAGVEASLAIGLPYILTFYVLLGILRDSGYLNSVAFLADRAMHRLGLHGHAILPLVAAAGCNVPAVAAADTLPDDRERFIASALAAMVPCSARTAVILGAVGHYLGLAPTLAVFGIVLLLDLGTGLLLDRFLPGRSSGLVMEMFPFRRPKASRVIARAWDQFREFVYVAMPIVVVGSLVLGGLYETGWLTRLAEPLSPLVTGLLGLPAVAGLTLLLGLLRKELALQLLVAMAVAITGSGTQDLTTFMSSTDIVVFALVNTLAFPCISTIAVLARRQGWRRAALVVGWTLVVALVTGGTAARVLPLLGWS